ncbi:MAG: F0F1 ATP synthase subunit delta [Spirochaetaceae bacterium]|jgi:F-type H+-transporting ATPase subunit delta|nr:F0F1 ATP synthase subunit delta [Spirochaetaceae bacterium]
MFAAERWAEAFVNALGENPKVLDEGIEAFKTLISFLEKLEKKERLSGKATAARLERVIREAGGGNSAGVEYACRLTVLLVARGRFTPHNGGKVLAEIETLRNRKRGILTVTVDSAVPPDEELLKTLRESIKNRRGAAEIHLIPRIIPELIGGYRLHIGSELVDASLRSLLRNMAAHLQAVPAGTGGVAW